ncbi:hypothetical protein [Parabacteroides sp. AM08-6]|uniref:alginate O-acetyltransferase AlgX-related protein n=1 Tax=Parabacteroides sp. AM08-6 TaxID=2292053 RepID=UPI000F010006|nr:hypothetical protein [Parabacteroides sp. AM08-6]RHJ87652.1 hypothetical protein DW103_00295 [Parabacteroides sp. AM08-6]
MKREKYTLSREIEANEEINDTKMSLPLARIAVWSFIIVLAGVPFIQLFWNSPFKKEYFNFLPSQEIEKTSSFLNKLLSYNNYCIRFKSEWEDKMEDISFLQNYSSVLFQSVLTEIFHTGNEKAIIAKDGWMFYDKDIFYLTNGNIPIQNNLFQGNTISPSECIIDFSRQLKNQGIELVIMPIPVKPVLYPEKLNTTYSQSEILQNQGYTRFITELKEEGVSIFDPTTILHSMKKSGKDIFLKTDTHWTPEAMEKTAEALSDFLTNTVSIEKGTYPYQKKTADIIQNGDIYTMLELKKTFSSFPPEKVTVHSILNSNGEFWQPSKNADILFLGDSFSNIYSLEGMGWGKVAGLAEHLSYFLQQPIDVIRRNDEASIATRKILEAEQKGGRDRLAGKKVVIWEFAMRELTQGNWTLLDMATVEPVQTSSFLTLTGNETILVEATVAEHSAAPQPDKVIYEDHVIALHLTNLTDQKKQLLGKEAFVYMQAMKGRKLTPAASLKSGDVIVIQLESWELHETIEGAYNRNELDNPDLLLEVPLWGTLVKVK